MADLHTELTTPRVTYVQPPPADSTPEPIPNTTTLAVEPVTASVINSPDDATGSSSTDGTVAEPPPYTPGDLYTQNRIIGQIEPVNWTKALGVNMSDEVRVQLKATEAIAPEAPTPGVPTWSEFYGVPAITEQVESSQIENPDNSEGSNSVPPPAIGAPPTSYRSPNGLFVIQNSDPFWWPDLTNITQGSFHSTPYIGPPQPIGN